MKHWRCELSYREDGSEEPITRSIAGKKDALQMAERTSAKASVSGFVEVWLKDAEGHRTELLAQYKEGVLY